MSLSLATDAFFSFSPNTSASISIHSMRRMTTGNRGMLRLLATGQKCNLHSIIPNHLSLFAVCHVKGVRRKNTLKARAVAGIASIVRSIRWATSHHISNTFHIVCSLWVTHLIESYGRDWRQPLRFDIRATKRNALCAPRAPCRMQTKNSARTYPKCFFGPNLAGPSARWPSVRLGCWSPCLWAVFSSGEWVSGDGCEAVLKTTGLRIQTRMSY